MEEAPSSLVAYLTDTNVVYRGRAQAEMEEGEVVLIVKEDGSVVVHDLVKNIQPLFYNPAGDTHWSLSEDRIRVNAQSEDGEVLEVEGRIDAIHVPENPPAIERPERTWRGGTEQELVRWVEENPEEVDLNPGEIADREHHRVGGRVDLLLEDGVVEVKTRAGVAVYDQLSRYLRDRGLERGIVVCFRASQGLKDLVGKDERMRLEEIDQDRI